MKQQSYTSEKNQTGNRRYAIDTHMQPKCSMYADRQGEFGRLLQKFRY